MVGFETDRDWTNAMQLTDTMLHSIENVIRDRFPGKVRGVEIRPGTDEAGENVLMIKVIMARDTTAADFSGRFFGLTRLVRNAMGDDMRGVFPLIRPVEEHA